jgi:transposase
MPPKRKKQHSRQKGGGQQKRGKQSATTPSRTTTANVAPASTAKKAKQAARDIEEGDEEMADEEEQDLVDSFFEFLDPIVENSGVLARKGGAIEGGMATMWVRQVYHIARTRAERGTLRYLEGDSLYPDLGPIYSVLAGISGSDSKTVRNTFEAFVDGRQVMIEDTSNRGRGSSTVDSSALRERSPEQYTAIENFVDFCNEQAGGKVTLEQIQHYMMHGPRPESDDPKFPAGCERITIPRTSLRHLLKEHLGYHFGYKKGKSATYMKPKARHARIRKFAIEMSRALEMESGGDWRIVFTDESYINQNHSPLTTWQKEGKDAKSPSGKGKRLVILHAISTGDFVCEYIGDESGMGIEEGGVKGIMQPENTAEWVWEAKASRGDYHDQMDGDMFEWWLENRLFPAFEAKYGSEMKMILVMDNASYHHQLNQNYYPKDVNPSNCSKAWHAHVLRKAGCTSITIERSDCALTLSVPSTEPDAHRRHRESGERCPKSGEPGTVYKLKGKDGASSNELYAATIDWLKANCPDALDSKVEREFRARGWKIIWTPPYAPRFQPIELVWGVAKQRVAWSYTGKRNMKQTHEQLRVGFYGGTIGDGFHKHTWSKTNVAGCWETAKKELNKWIQRDSEYNDDGLTGSLENLGNIDKWTETADDCLDIGDIDLGGESGEEEG